MKTKIIYISGSEVFDMRDVRAAFDAVRATLGLSQDTILFGVPVDSDSALDAPVEKNESVECSAVVEPVVPECPIATVEPEPEIVVQTETIVDSEPIPEPAPDEIIDTESQDKIIPITSILTAVSVPVESEQSVVEPVIEQDVVTEPVSESVVSDVKSDEPVITDIAIDSELAAPAIDTDDTETVTLGDMISDDAPVAPMEKTLEQLLESMKPLREDLINDEAPVSDEVIDDTDMMPPFETDADATLAQLASEFAENEDKIVNTKPKESSGKIGKLKNILPFKKAKRDDNGLMGDLFGWAGIAANDDDFAMPGFFTNAVGKK